jgi:hypothetical protein
MTYQKTAFFIVTAVKAKNHTMLLVPGECLIRKSSIIKNGLFWDVTPCDSCKSGLFGVT